MALTISRLRFVSMDTDDEGATLLRFHGAKPLRFTAGQHGLWYVPGGGIKPFSFASSPGDHEVALGTTLASGSRMKRALGSLTRGSTVWVLGPLSDFTSDAAATEIVMLAQGTAVTPFRSILGHVSDGPLRPRTALIHVGKAHPFRRDTEPIATSALYPGGREEFEQLVGDAALEHPAASFMVAGTPAFVASTKVLLAANGVPSAQVKGGAFVGWTGPHA